MSDKPACPVPTQLRLESRMEDLALVHPWVEALAEYHAIPPPTVFAINLCLEEALANVVRHGYKDTAGSAMTVAFETHGERELSFVVEDSAPHFDPTVAPMETPAVPLEEMKIGGNGILLMRKFAGSVKWEPLEHGNRLRIGFVLP
ncbi:MAG TPA: ATP-binding protein [Terracidiphilus sp.]|nr:ATP-binding protein [Terracidiphilus sp.]